MISVRRLGDSDWRIYRDLQLASLTDAPDAAWLTYDEAARRSEADWRDNLYRRHGFRRTGRRQVIPRDASLIEVEMVVGLGADGGQSKTQGAQI
ncbi:hypothetical protein OG874_22920 [Nocardia sp. NBC_00565]|uniref:hypothetical protein n=1 Tax=Nocardia sp. NBC_00565 TaxID=2975993 RepID=UPI002E80F516|nr:hypothetical protein [Nocardia sp. NBC_00565]WUB99788.1 hypothetical protein OG874_22920 [Nocardia sp. NBC_00565]